MKYVVAILLLAVASLAQAKVQYFNLHQEVEERVFLCMEKDVAIDMVKFAAKGDMESLQLLSISAQRAQVCGIVPLRLTYTKQVFRQDGDAIYTVYEAKSGEVTIYVPLKNYLHKDV